MHPYSYNRLQLDARSQAPHDSESASSSAGGTGENNTTDGAGSSPDIASLMAMLEAMNGKNPDGARAGLPPDFMKLLTMMQSMSTGAAGGNMMQNMLPLLSMLGGGLAPNMKSVLESASQGGNSNGSMFNLLQGMMPPQAAQLFNMLSSFRS